LRQIDVLDSSPLTRCKYKTRHHLHQCGKKEKTWCGNEKKKSQVEKSSIGGDGIAVYQKGPCAHIGLEEERPNSLGFRAIEGGFPLAGTVQDEGRSNKCSGGLNSKLENTLGQKSEKRVASLPVKNNNGTTDRQVTNRSTKGKRKRRPIRNDKRGIFVGTFSSKRRRSKDKQDRSGQGRNGRGSLGGRLASGNRNNARVLTFLLQKT